MRSFEDWQMWHHVTPTWLVSAWGRTTVYSSWRPTWQCQPAIGNMSHPFGMDHSFCVAHSLKTTTMLIWTWYSANSVYANLGNVICQVQRANLFAKLTCWTDIIFESQVFAANQNSDRGGKNGWLLSENWCDNLTIDLVSVNLPPATWPLTITIRLWPLAPQVFCSPYVL